MRRIAKYGVQALLTSMMMSGCIYVGQTKLYSPPEGAALNNSSTLIGARVSAQENRSQQTTFLLAVDGEAIKKKSCQYDTPVLLSSGAHSVDVAFFEDRSLLYGRQKIAINVPVGDKLVIRHSRGTEPIALLWIESGVSGAILGEMVKTELKPHEMAKAPIGFQAIHFSWFCP